MEDESAISIQTLEPKKKAPPFPSTSLNRLLLTSGVDVQRGWRESCFLRNGLFQRSKIDLYSFYLLPSNSVHKCVFYSFTCSKVFFRVVIDSLF